MFYFLFVIGIGAVAGAWLRWGLGILLNPIFPVLPLGTLAANLIGGFLVGIILVLIRDFHLFSEEVRLGIIVGFLGGLTTFSTFSAEAVQLLLRAEYLWGMILIISHVMGSVIMTVLGMLMTKYLFS